MNELSDNFSLQCSIKTETENMYDLDMSLPEKCHILPSSHSVDAEREYLKTAVKTISLWRMKIKKGDVSSSPEWMKFRIYHNDKLQYYQKYITFDGSNDIYNDLPDNIRTDITKLGKVIILTRRILCSKSSEPDKVLKYLKKTYTFLNDVISPFPHEEEVKQDDKMKIIIKKIKKTSIKTV